jgi:hypothetical protein
MHLKNDYWIVIEHKNSLQTTNDKDDDKNNTSRNVMLIDYAYAVEYIHIII